VANNGQILGRVIDGCVELRFESPEGQVCTARLSPEDFACFVQAMALLTEELWPPDDLAVTD
jgi:hypothetical protein